ncbi:MAG: thiamine pyrophosphate-binding protein [Gemmatimonadota bacterium]
MRESGGRAVVKALEDEGVALAFGIPGTHNIELYDALGESGEVTPVLVTNEQSASFMADGVWRSSGRLACLNLVPGAGLTHALSGVAEAYLDHAALLVLACGIPRDEGPAFQLHDVDQLAIAAPVTKAQLRPERGEDIYAAVRRACRIARADPPGPVMVEIPSELYMVPHTAPRAAAGDCAFSWEPPAPPVASPDDVARAARLLGAARRPLLYLGLGAAPAGEALVRLAERLEAPVSTTLQGKGVFPERHPLFLWPGFGAAAPRFAREIAAECDATLALGCRFAEVATGGYGAPPPGRLVHVDVNPEVPGRNYPAEVAIAADSAVFVEALLEALGPPESARGRAAPKATGDPSASKEEGAARAADPALRDRIRRGHTEVRETWRAESESTPEGRVSPPRLLAALQERFGPDAVFTADSGNGTFLAMECLRLDRPFHLLAPVDYSCMGYSVPAAIGAAMARPERRAIALAGDGAFLMTGWELLTAASRGVPVLVLVLRDGELAQIAQFQDVAFHRKVASRLPDYDLAALSAGLGVECRSLTRNEDIGSALEWAEGRLRAGRPAVVDVAIDYSHKTYFTRGVVKTVFLRQPWRERARMLGRAALRKLTG